MQHTASIVTGFTFTFPLEIYYTEIINGVKEPSGYGPPMFAGTSGALKLQCTFLGVTVDGRHPMGSGIWIESVWKRGH